MKFSLEKSLAILRNTPTVLETLFSNLDDEWINSNEGENSWSPKQVLAHLILCEETDWLSRITIILQNPETVFAPIDMEAHLEQAKKFSVTALLTAFAEKRKQSLDVLAGWHLQESDFVKTGIHPRLGNITLQQLLATWTTHDLSHLAQIARVMAKQYKEEVGSFSHYLKILHS